MDSSSTTSLENYEYSLIDPEKPIFRLLRLLSGEDDDPIQCELFETPLQELEDGITYEALSYTWGSNEITVPIIVSNNIINITENLHEALEYLRYPDMDRILWVDAICIDQSNLRERNHQVKHMRPIYIAADKVIFWLGPSADGSDLLFDWMNLLRDQAKSIWVTESDWQRLVSFWVDFRSDIWQGMYTFQQAQKSLKALLERPWFRRIWILQEVANSRDAIVMCGAHSIAARVFAYMPSLLKVEPDRHSQAVLDLMPGLSRQQSWWSTKRDLHTLLLKFTDSQASDQRDMIYALLALSSDAQDTAQLRADYTKTLQETMRDTMVFLLSSWSRLDFSQSQINLESWSDFSKELSRIGSFAYRLAEQGKDQAIASKLLFISHPEQHLEGDPRQSILLMAVREKRADIIEKLLENHINVNFKDDLGHTPLINAVLSRFNGGVKLLSAYNQTDINMECNQTRSPLSYAAELGYAEITDLLLRGQSIVVDSKDVRGWTPLLYAAKNGHGEIVEKLVRRSDIDINCCDARSWTPLMYALSNNHECVLKQLLASGKILDDAFEAAGMTQNKSCIEIDPKAAEYRTALHTAASLNQVGLIAWLLEKNVCDNFEDATSSSIDAAIQNSHPDAIKLLLASHADQYTSDSYSTLIQKACSENRIDILQLLIRARIDVHSNGLYNMALIEESSKGHMHTVQALIQAAGAGIREDLYHSAITAACSNARTEVIGYLLEMGAKDTDLLVTALAAAASAGRASLLEEILGMCTNNSLEKHRIAPALVTASRNGHFQVIERLLEYVSDSSPVYRSYGNALIAASSGGHVQIVAVLLQRSSDFELRRSLHPALEEALSNDYIHVAETLITKARDLNIAKAFFDNSLVTAASTGKLLITKRLLEYGTPVSEQVDILQRALVAAAGNGHYEVVQEFLERGADINRVGESALNAAGLRGHFSVVELLLERGADVAAKGLYLGLCNDAVLKRNDRVLKLLEDTTRARYESAQEDPKST